MTRAVFCSALCLSLVLRAGAKAQKNSSAAVPEDAKRRAALAAYDAGRTAEAKSALEALAPRYPHDFQVQEALGLMDAEAGELQAALPHLVSAVAARPDDAGAVANLGAAYLALKRAPEAVHTLEKAAQLEPANAEVGAELGRALFLNGEPGPAAAALGKASPLRPGDADLLYDWVVALDASHQATAALAVLQTHGSANASPALQSLWGDVAEHAGHYQEAAEHMQTAARLDPSEANLYALCVELLRHWTWQPAQQVAAYGVSKYPASGRLRFAQGVALYGGTQFAEAADVFAALLKSAPDNETYGDLLGRSCAALGGSESANCGALTGFAEQHPGNARVAVFAAISLLHRAEDAQDLPKAEALLRGSIAHDPRNPEAFYQLGVLQQQRQQWAESAASLRGAIALRPSYAQAHYRLSRAYAHLGKKAEAEQELVLQKQYAQQEKEASDAQLKEVTIFLTQKP